MPLVCWNPPKGGISKIICNQLARWPLLNFGHAALLYEKQPLFCQVILSVTQQEYEPRHLAVMWFSGVSFSIWGWGSGGSLHTLAWSTPCPSSKMTLSTFPFSPQAVKSEAASEQPFPPAFWAGGEVVQLHNDRLCESSGSASSITALRCEGGGRGSSPTEPPWRRPCVKPPAAGVASEQLRVLGSLGVDQREELAASANHRPAKPPRYSCSWGRGRLTTANGRRGGGSGGSNRSSWDSCD